MYSIIDIEGNGGAYRKERIIDIAIFRYDGQKIVDQFISLVDPEDDISQFVQKLTGITPKMVRTAPKFHEIAKRIIEITQNSTLVGHNIDFDYRMLRQSFKNLGYEFKINTLDTIPLAQKLIPEAESYSLSKLVKSLGIPLLNAHRADGDARATLELFKLLMNKDTRSEIIQKQFEESNAKTYTNKVKELTQDLPNERGFIYFQNREGEIVHHQYVQDLNKYAKKIFNASLPKWENIQQSTQQIHYELTGTDFIAKLILKSRGITKKENLSYGLFEKNGKLVVEKNTLNKGFVPILKFKSFTQGVKVVEYIKSQDRFQNIDELKKTVSVNLGSGVLLGAGRKLGERIFIQLEKSKPIAFGFYELFTQIQTMTKMDHLKINLPPNTTDLVNDLKLGLLSKEFEFLPMPK